MSFSNDYTKTVRGDFMSHVRPEILDLYKRGSITYDEYAELRANSYECRLLHEKLTDDALIQFVRSVMLVNCQGRPLLKYEIPRHYDDAVIREFVPMLLDRMESLLREAANKKL